MLNGENLKLNIKKMEKYKQDEELLIEDIDNSFININYSYKSKNTESLDKLESEILNNLNIINTNHNKYIILLNKKIIQYQKTTMESNKILNNINFGGTIINDR